MVCVSLARANHPKLTEGKLGDYLDTAVVRVGSAGSNRPKPKIELSWEDDS